MTGKECGKMEEKQNYLKAGSHDVICGIQLLLVSLVHELLHFELSVCNISEESYDSNCTV